MARDAVLAAPQINPITISIAIFGILFLDLGRRFVNPLFQRRFRIPLPLELFLVILSISMSTLLELYNRYHVKIVKNVPRQLPPPSLPEVRVLPVIWYEGIEIECFRRHYLSVLSVITISIICFIFPYALAKTFAKKHKVCFSI